MMRPGEPPTEDAVQALFQRLFYNPDTYDLSRVGRMKFNARWAAIVDRPDGADQRDILSVVKILVDLRNGRGARSTTSTTWAAAACAAWVNWRKPVPHGSGAHRNREGTSGPGRAGTRSCPRPHQLKPISAALREFFGASQLSQFMDQTNPLAEITHKRRVSAWAGRSDARARRLQVRDVRHALRPRLPYRNAGRPEHRPDRSLACTPA